MELRLLIIFILSSINVFSQGGTWAWISGDSATGPVTVYGIQGVPSVNNRPQAVYEPVEWKDKDGNFWMYGGIATFTDNYSDLWRFNPVTREWTWVKGNGIINESAVVGTIGVPGILNTPGTREWGSASWVDTSGYLWLFGGTQSFWNDLWKYDITTNEWTCMRGPTYGNYGVQGIPDVNNKPWGRSECTSNWTDQQNNLWLFGGLGFNDSMGGSGYKNDVWKYSIGTNEWTWMNGTDSATSPGHYGTKGISDPLNAPSGRQTYCKWKQDQDNFWIMGGSNPFMNGSKNDVWRYNLPSNEWTWMDGNSSTGDTGHYQQYCAADSLNFPSCRFEHRSSVTDACGKFWMYGGLAFSQPLNDLWLYDPTALRWKLLSGTNFPASAGSYGTLGISSPSNLPPARCGAVAWWGDDNRFYLFGGSTMAGIGGPNYCKNDLWLFTPDTTCIAVCVQFPPAAGIQNSSQQICPGSCTVFINLSSNATSCQWYFPGGNPSTSFDFQPPDICYQASGSYDVTLIATNANGSDTLTLTNYITIYPQPLPQSITQNGDTLSAIPGATSYQWYFNGNIINGATDYFYAATQSGNYNVVATDSNGCEVEAVINNVIAGNGQLAIGSWQLAIFPNPVSETIDIRGLELNSNYEISIFNVVGEKVFSAVDCKLPIANCQLSSGMYYIEINTNNKTFRSKFLKSTYR